MVNYYKIEIKGKNVYRFFNKILQSRINIFDCIYKKDKIVFKVSYEDYLKIKKLNTIYEINIIEIRGKEKITKEFQFYKTYLILFAIGLILVLFYANIILKIEINTNNIELKELVVKELNNNKITLYTFKKSFKNLEKIAGNIKNNNKDIIDWIEIKKDGVSYQVNIIEKISKNNNQVSNKNNIVAAKNGMLLDLYVSNGQVVKHKGDYVSKGEVIISGYITKNDDIKNIVAANGEIYAETWYKVKITHPTTSMQQQDEKGQIKIKLNCFNKEITLLKFKVKKLKKAETIKIFNNNLFNLYIEKVYDENLVIKKYSEKELIQKVEDMAKQEILKNLEGKEKILLQKTLKIDDYNDKMYIEVFFKVYEDIAEKQEIQEIQQ